MNIIQPILRPLNSQIAAEKEALVKEIEVKFQKEIDLLEKGSKLSRKDNPEYALEVDKQRLNLILEKSLADMKAEAIIRERIQLKVTYYMMIISCIAMTISVISLFVKT